jgi:putative ABC transport system permease protein
VAMLGLTAARTLFGDSSAALGQTVQINHVPFRVIGVMASYGQQQGNTAVIPLDTARRYIYGHGQGSTSRQLDQITAQATQQANVPVAMAEITHILDTATTSPIPSSVITRFNPWDRGCKISTRSSPSW